MTTIVRPAAAPDRADDRAASARRPDLHAAVLPAVLTVLAVAAGLVSVLIAALVLGDPGRLNQDRATSAGSAALGQIGLPIAIFVSRVAAVGTVGALVLVAVLGAAATTPNARPDDGGHVRRMVVVSALGWVLATTAVLVLTAGLLDVQPGMVSFQLVPSLLTSDEMVGQLLMLGLASLVLVVASGRRNLAPTLSRYLLAIALVAVVPTTLVGHAAAGPHPRLAVMALVVHVLAATVWVGGVLSLVVLHRSCGGTLPAAARRLSSVSLVCFVLVGVSGVLTAASSLEPDALSWGGLTRDGYGRLLGVKALTLLLLLGFGWWHRHRTLRALDKGEARAFRRFAAGEVVVMLTAFALATALAVSPQPSNDTGQPSPGIEERPTAGAEAVPGRPTEGQAPDMSGHDHGPLVVSILITDSTFMVGAPVKPGAPVSVLNSEGRTHTIVATDGRSFKAVASAGSLLTFRAPATPGDYPFISSGIDGYRGILVVR